MASEQPPGSDPLIPSESTPDSGPSTRSDQPPDSGPSTRSDQPPGSDPSTRSEPAPGGNAPGGGGGADIADNVAASGAGGASDTDSDAKRKLCRSSSDRVIAGVAGGIGTYFGIDAVIVRIAFIVLTFLGGAGPFLYLIGWLALPREESRSVIADALAGNSPRRARNLLAVVLIGLGLLITTSLSDQLFRVFIDVGKAAPYLSLILIAVGVALVIWPGRAGRASPTPAGPLAPDASAEPDPASSAAPATTPPAAAGPGWAAAPPPPVTAAAVPRRSRARARRQGRTLIGYITFAVLLVYAGGTVVLHRLDAIEADVGVFLAIALAITGLGLAVSAFRAPARGLILLGVVLAAPLLLFVGAALPWASGVGDLRVSVSDPGDLRHEYRHGVGTMVVDLRDLEPDAGNAARSVEISLSVGELLVYVPYDVNTVADINVGAGNLTVWADGPDWSRSGVSVAHRIATAGDGPQGLRLDIDVAIGQAEIVASHVPVLDRDDPCHKDPFIDCPVVEEYR